MNPTNPDQTSEAFTSSARRDVTGACPSAANPSTCELLWPSLLRLPAMAARPQRLAFGFFLVVIAGLFASLGGAVLTQLADNSHKHYASHLLDALSNSLSHIISGTLHLSLQQATTGVVSLISSTIEFITLAPLSFVLSLIVALAVIGTAAILGGAISRSQACEFSQQIVHPWQSQLAFALARWKTLVGALLLPGVVLVLIWFILMIAGVLFFHTIPGLDLIGSLFFGLAGLISFVAVLVLLLWMYAGIMLIPAASCEGTDAIDATQRVFAYAIAKPLRLGLYQLIALGIVSISLTIASLLIQGSLAFASTSMATLASPTGRVQLQSSVVEVPSGNTATADTIEQYGMIITPHTPSDQPATQSLHGYPAIPHAIIIFWTSVASVILLAYATSMIFCSGTIIYLFMRQLVDGQHYAELWTPDHIDTPNTPSV